MFRQRFFLLSCFALLAAAASAPAIPTGSDLPDWYKTFSLDAGRRDFDFDATLLRTNRVGNLFRPGEQPEVELQIENLTGKPLQYKGFIELIDFGTENVDGDIWMPFVRNKGSVSKTPIDINLPPNGYQNIRYAPELPAKFSGYGIVVDLGPSGRRFAGSFARILKNDSKPVQYPKQSSEFFQPEVMKRIGLQAVRYGVPFHFKGTKKRAEQMKEMEELFARMKDGNVAVTLEIGAGDFSAGQPLGMPRPHLDENGVMLPTKSDLAWLPENDADFREFCAELTAKFGWPKGPVNGIMLWNEPWEGISISGWGADMLRYRTMYKIMGEAVKQACKENKVEVLVGGCDSSSNTFDKLFPDESGEFMPYFDFCSIHYQGLSAPSLYRSWIGRKPARVRIWDTESWVANSEDLLPGVIAANRASGYDRSMGFFGGYVFGNHDHHAGGVKKTVRTEKGKEKVELPLFAYPMAAGVAAMQHFIGDRDFSEIRFKTGLPWVFVFDGTDGDAEDGTVVLLGDLNAIFENTAPYPSIRSLAEDRDKAEIAAALPKLEKGTPEFDRLLAKYSALFPSRKLNAGNLKAGLEKLLGEPWPFRGVTLDLDAAPGQFALYDCYGNEIPPENGRYQIPMTTRGCYLRSAAKGGFAALLAAVDRSRLAGIERAELAARDFLTAVAPGAKLRLDIRNVTNAPLTGKLAGSVAGLTVKFPETVALAPFESREVEVEVTGGAANPANCYPLEFTLSENGAVVGKVKDVMHANTIARRTVEVDGKLEDWNGVAPQVLSTSGKVEGTMMEQAWLPFEKLAAGSGERTASAYLAYDKNFLYFAAKVADPTEHPGTLRFETRDDDEFFYPETACKYDEDKTYVTTLQQEENVSGCGVELPGSKERTAGCVRPVAVHSRYDFTLPADRTTKVTLYLPWDNFRSGRQARLLVLDRDSGKVLDRGRMLSELKGGGFVSYAARGNISVLVSNFRWWDKESGRVAGVFLDPLPDAKPGKGTSASYLGVDENDPGRWNGRFGKEGYFLPGAKLASFQPGYDCKLRDDDVKTALKWPEGVRRYSYRKRPVLPDGQSPACDNVQLAFNAIPADADPIEIPCLPGRMPGFVLTTGSDYEFALNKVAPQYGGGVEIWRLQVPDGVRKHFYPRQPRAPWEGAVKDGKLAIVYRDGTRFVEAAIPWSEIPAVKALLDAGKPVKLAFRINDNSGASLESNKGRSAARPGFHTFHPDWKRSYSNEIEFQFEK